MSTLIAIGYPDESTAASAAQEARRLAEDLIIEPEAIASIVRDQEGKFHVNSGQHAVGSGTMWGLFWGLLFGVLFFIPVLGMAVGAGFGALLGKVGKGAIDKEFENRVREMLKPGTSALFLVVERATPDKAIAGLGAYGGTVLRSSLSEESEAKLQRGLDDADAAAAAGVR